MSRFEDIQGIADLVMHQSNDIEQLRSVCKALLNKLEEFARVNDKLSDEVRLLKDEVSRLKGEKGKPNFKPKNQKKDISSEAERKDESDKKQEPKSKAKLNKIIVNRTELLRVEKSKLPADAEFKGYQEVIIQDLKFINDNIKFRKEVYYSRLLGKAIVAEMPKGYTGEFGPGIKSLILSLHNSSANMTHGAIIDFLNTHGVHISAASIARILLAGERYFAEEKAAIIEAGLRSSQYQHIDDTGARVNGSNHYLHVLCNEFYTAYFTRENKSRLTVLEILNGNKLKFRFDDNAYFIMESLNLSKKSINNLKASNPDLELSISGLTRLLAKLYPDSEHENSKRIITEAAAISAYQHSSRAIPILVCDDAPQFKHLTKGLALCWVHEGRHYKKLNPILNVHRAELECFLDKFWSYYRELVRYSKSPSQTYAQELARKFDNIFGSAVAYEDLAHCMQQTMSKKAQLLTVLYNPDVPLNNNPAELAARAQARKRDISFYTKTSLGTNAKDTMLTIVQTAKKLGVNIYNYIYDRVSAQFNHSSLADIIISKSQCFAKP
jgi:hypothetical protein